MFILYLVKLMADIHTPGQIQEILKISGQVCCDSFKMFTLFYFLLFGTYNSQFTLGCCLKFVSQSKLKSDSGKMSNKTMSASVSLLGMKKSYLVPFGFVAFISFCFPQDHHEIPQHEDGWDQQDYQRPVAQYLQGSRCISLTNKKFVRTVLSSPCRRVSTLSLL